MKGKLIVFEGNEGSGKTTIAKKFYEWCLKNKIDAILSREPGGVASAEDIREIILNKKYEEEIDPLTELLLFEAARREHYVRVIKPALKAGKVVILDRFILSTLAIQGCARKIDINLINKLNTKTTDSTKADFTVLLDVDYNTAMNRIKTNNRTTNRLDDYGKHFFNSVNKGFHNYAYWTTDNIIIINTSNLSEEEVFNELISNIKSYKLK